MSGERFLHTFDEWITRTNKRLTRLERRLPFSGGSSDVPDPLIINQLQVSGSAIVPYPTLDNEAATKAYVDDQIAALPGARGVVWFISGVGGYSDPADVPSPQTNDVFLYPNSGDLFVYNGTSWVYRDTIGAQHLSAGTGISVTGTGTAASPWVVTNTRVPGAWSGITLGSPFVLRGAEDLWQVRADGDMFEWTQCLLSVSVTTTFTAGTNYTLGTLPPAFVNTSRRGPYMTTQMRAATGTAVMTMLYNNSGNNQIQIQPLTNITLTAGTAHYVIVEPVRWRAG